MLGASPLLLGGLADCLHHLGACLSPCRPLLRPLPALSLSFASGEECLDVPYIFAITSDGVAEADDEQRTK